MPRFLLASYRAITDRRNIIISVLLFAIVAIQLMVLFPEDVERLDERPKDVTSPVASKEEPVHSSTGQVVNDAHMVRVKAGKEVELWAKKASQPRGADEWTLEDVRVKFFGSNGVTYTVTGKTGGVKAESYAMWIKGSVVTKSSNGYTFKTEQAFYDPNTRRLSSPGAVEMEGPADKTGSRLDLTGEEMMADMMTNQLQINRNVKGTRQVPGERMAKIQSNSALFSGKTNLAQFTGAVVIDIETMRITGPRAEFAYEPTSGQLDSVMVAGGVRVTDADKYATSGSLAVFFRDDRYVFRGSPRVVQNEDELIGDEIVFLDGGKKVQVINARAALDPNAIRDDKSEQNRDAGDGKKVKR